MIRKEQMKKIQAFAIDIDWNGAFAGASKGNRHLFRTVAKAILLAKKVGARTDIVEAGAWLHDTNLEQTITGETLANKEKVVEFLKTMGLEDADIKSVLHCIEAHDGRILATTIEAKVVHDADTLEKSGPLGIIRETWKRCQAGWNTEKIADHLQTHINKRAERLYTDVAKEMANTLNHEIDPFLKVLNEQIKEKQ